MFEVGFSEMLLISALALIVLGPQKLPRLASQLGHWVGRARTMARQFRDQLEQEVSLEEIAKPSPPPAAEVVPSSDDAANTVHDAQPAQPEAEAQPTEAQPRSDQ